MPISTTVTQYNRFVNFATEAQSELDIAHVGDDSPLGGRNISAYKGDSVHAFRRSNDSKKVNDHARDLFRRAIVEMFGGEKQIPPSVRKAMLLSDFGKGRPLTARRILAVKAAVDAVTAVDNGNKAISNAVSSLSFGKLPEPIKNVIDQVGLEMLRRGGDDMPDTREGFVRFINGGRAKIALDARGEKTWRPLTPADVGKALRGLIKEQMLLEVHKLSGFMKPLVEREGLRVDVSRATAMDMMAAVPGLKKALCACKRPDDFEPVFRRYEARIRSHLAVMAEASAFKERAKDMVVGEFAKATGFDENYLRENLPLEEFRKGAAEDLRSDISNGKVRVKTPQEIEAAFRNMARAYAKAHVDIAKQAADLKGVPEAARRSLYKEALFARKSKEFKIAEYAPLAAKLDLARLREAVLRKPFSAKAVAPVLHEAICSLAQIGRDHCGVNKWMKMGVDGQQPYATIVFTIALGNDTELARALSENGDELLAETSALVPPQEHDTVSILSSAIPAAKSLVTELDAEP